MDPIAIIGMSARVPGARDVRQFWDNLRNGRESISFFAEEKLVAPTPSSTRPGQRYVRAGGILEGIDQFDAELFEMSPGDAAILDPQQRLFLEGAWDALDDAGCDPERFPGLIGVFGGAAPSTYLDLLRASRSTGAEEMHANSTDFLATRVAFKLNLTGPAVSVQTACSTSLTAIVVACRALQDYDCDIALAGGVRITVPQMLEYRYRDGDIMSPDGHCRAFDRDAAGTVPGNGMGIVVLRRLSDAVTNGDSIRALVIGSAANNDGARKVGFTAPSVEGQAQAIAMAQAMAGVTPAAISYIEAHGTGTRLGDPIEVAALSEVFASAGTDKRCALGSVKTNLGHLDRAAGVIGLIKTVLSFENEAIPPTLHYKAPNPEIDFAATPFFVNDRLQPWRRGDSPRRAGVTSLGIGGTNAHVVLEEAPVPTRSASDRPVHLLPLSAHTSAALDASAASLADYLESTDDDLADIAFTLQTGRREMGKRRAVVATSASDAAARLRTLAPISTGVSSGASTSKVAFLLPGHGVLHHGMARELYWHEPVFRTCFDAAAAAVERVLGANMSEIVFGANVGRIDLRLTSITQPVMVGLEIALARLWESWGVRPSALLGHSLGEYAAACLAGVFSVEDCLRLVALRGRCVDACPAGAMSAVDMGEDELREFLKSTAATVDIAAVNGPALVTIAGPVDAIGAAERRLGERGVRCMRLEIPYAFHSAMIEPALFDYRVAVMSVARNAPAIPVISNLTGGWLTAQQAMSTDYWVEHLRCTVRFGAGLSRLIADRGFGLLEVGPGTTLSKLARTQIAADDPLLVVASLPRSSDAVRADETMLRAAGTLWERGHPVDLAAILSDERRRRVRLPAYPMQRRRHWVTREDSAPIERPSAEPRGDLADFVYAATWTRETAMRQPRGAGVHAWLVFADPSGLSAELMAGLGNQQTSIRVFAGSCFRKIDDATFEIRPGNRSDIASLVEAIPAETRPNRVLHCWSTGPIAPALTLDVFDEEQLRGYFTLQWTVQALLAADSCRLGIDVVGSGLYRVSDEPVAAERVLMEALGRGIARQASQVSCRIIDTGADVARLHLTKVGVESVVRELETWPSTSVVALRGNRRWIPTYVAAPLAAPTRCNFVQRGTYVITGGFGRLGLSLGRYLAERYGARLVLVGKRPSAGIVPYPESRAQAADAGDATRLKAVRLLEDAGGDVLPLAGDIGKPQVARWVLQSARERFGKIDGIIHCSAVTDASKCRAVRGAEHDVIDEHFHAKARTLLSLRSATKPGEVPLWILFSSINAMFGATGHEPCCAANAFLDAYAEARDGHDGERWVSVDWDRWQVEDGQSSPIVGDRLLALGEGHELLERILEHAADARVTISTADLNARRARWMRSGEDALPHRVRRSGRDEEPDTAPPPAGGPLESRTALEIRISEVWSRVLGIKDVGIHDDFFQLGGHSLLAIRLMDEMRAATGSDLPAQQLFDTPTIAALSRAIEEAGSAQAGNAAEDVLRSESVTT